MKGERSVIIYIGHEERATTIIVKKDENPLKNIFQRIFIFFHNYCRSSFFMTNVYNYTPFPLHPLSIDVYVRITTFICN